MRIVERQSSLRAKEEFIFFEFSDGLAVGDDLRKFTEAGKTAVEILPRGGS
jgi:hypothetical protein